MIQSKFLNSILIGFSAVMVLLSCTTSADIQIVTTGTSQPSPVSAEQKAPLANTQEELKTTQAEPIPAKLIREELPSEAKPEPVTFREIWGYVQAGDESSLDPAWPVSDVALFSASISSTGKVRGVPKRSRLSDYPGKVHLVVAELGNYALTHFSLNPSYPVRSSLITQIVEAAQHKQLAVENLSWVFPFMVVPGEK